MHNHMFFYKQKKLRKHIGICWCTSSPCVLPRCAPRAELASPLCSTAFKSKQYDQANLGGRDQVQINSSSYLNCKDTEKDKQEEIHMKKKSLRKHSITHAWEEVLEDGFKNRDAEAIAQG